ncbi:MAG: histidinol-phosphatase [Victivallales bacterium]|nr:histidinol-phosphatase [Victivallales bacterium]
MLTSYHNHSTWSDGIASIREMALAARDAGVTEFGISDHLVLAPNPVIASKAASWSMKPEAFGAYVLAAQEVKNELQTPAFQFRIGVEADFFEENIDSLKAMLTKYPQVDYVIGACHYAGDFEIDHATEDWEPLDEASRQRIWEVYLDKIQGVCQAGYCDFIAHLDLPKKFGALLPDALKPKMEQLLQAISQSGVAMEVNTAGLDKPCQEWYPSEEILHRAVALGIPLLVNADAHATSQVVRHFSEARAALRAAAITQVCEFTEHRRRMIPLD